MQMKFKKTGAALLVATMTVTGASYAWANENLFDTVDLNKVLNQNETENVEAQKTVTPDTTTGDTVGMEIEIPEGYNVGNLVALSKAYENAGNETAKAAIKRNAERAIAKFEAKQAETPEPIKQAEPKKEDPIVQPPVKEEPKTEVTVTETPVVKPVEETPVVNQPVVNQPVDQTKQESKQAVKETKQAVKETKQAVKEERKALQQEQKEERKALQAEHKEEKKALKEDRKAEKHENKENKDQK